MLVVPKSCQADPAQLFSLYHFIDSVVPEAAVEFVVELIVTAEPKLIVAEAGEMAPAVAVLSSTVNVTSDVQTPTVARIVLLPDSNT